MGEAIESMVVIEKEEYSNMVIAQEHMRNIYKIAFDGAELGWNKNDIRLDTETVGQYLKSIFFENCKYKLEALKAEESNGQPDNN